MAKVRFLASTKVAGLEFKIVGRRIEDEDDPEKARVYLTLEGAKGIRFERMVDDKILEKYGYVLVVREDPAPAA